MDDRARDASPPRHSVTNAPPSPIPSDNEAVLDEHAWEWVRLLPVAKRVEIVELDRARRDVERQIVHLNQAKLAGRGHAGPTRRGSFRGIPPAAAGRTSTTGDVISSSYSQLQGVDATRLARLLPRPGDGEREKQQLLERTGEFLQSLRARPGYGLLTWAVTAAAAGVYVAQTYLLLPYPAWVYPCEWAFLAVLSADLALALTSADDALAWAFSLPTLVDLLSVLPSAVTLAGGPPWGFLRFLRLLRHSRPPDLSHLLPRRRRPPPPSAAAAAAGWRAGLGGGVGGGDGMSPGASDVEWEGERLWRRMYELFVLVARFSLVAAGALLLLENASSKGGSGGSAVEDAQQGGGGGGDMPPLGLSFDAALYFVLASVVTLGYGDVVPVSAAARLLSAAGVIAFLPFLGGRVGRVARAAEAWGGGGRRRTYAPGNVREQHVVLCGSLTAVNVRAGLRELFHADHGRHNVRWVKVVLLSPGEPAPEMRALLGAPACRGGRVRYVRGSALSEADLRRAAADEAAAVMVLSNKLAAGSHREDTHVSLRALSVLTHVQAQRRMGGGPRLLVELIDPNAALHLRSAGIRHVVSSDQLKLSVLAQSCLCPGWSAIVANLLQSRAALPPEVLKQGSWLAEYYVGVKKTFYSVEFSPAFVGRPFADVVAHAFELFELIIVAVERRRAQAQQGSTRAHGGKGEFAVLVNPGGGYRVRRGDRAFVLAESQADARLVWDYMGAVDDEGGGGGGARATGTTGRPRRRRRRRRCWRRSAPQASPPWGPGPLWRAWSTARRW